ncbi:MAG: Hsp20/alpha crystallin family protein [Rariglobus sp.]
MSLLTSILPSFATAPSDTATTGAPVNASTPARRPAYRVTETAEGYALTVNLPGVTKDNLGVIAEDGVLNITGKRSWQKPEAWTALHRESADAGFALSLAYDDAIDADKITAALNDGVLRLTLPKAEARKPRKIAVN